MHIHIVLCILMHKRREIDPKMERQLSSQSLYSQPV